MILFDVLLLNLWLGLGVVMLRWQQVTSPSLVKSFWDEILSLVFWPILLVTFKWEEKHGDDDEGSSASGDSGYSVDTRSSPLH